jgi:hypothetical protein
MDSLQQEINDLKKKVYKNKYGFDKFYIYIWKWFEK